MELAKACNGVRDRRAQTGQLTVDALRLLRTSLGDRWGAGHPIRELRMQRRKLVLGAALGQDGQAVRQHLERVCDEGRLLLGRQRG